MNEMNIWNVTSGAKYQSYWTDFSVENLNLLSDGVLAIGNTNYGVKLWSIKEAKLLKVISPGAWRLSILSQNSFAYVSVGPYQVSFFLFNEKYDRNLGKSFELSIDRIIFKNLRQLSMCMTSKQTNCISLIRMFHMARFCQSRVAKKSAWRGLITIQ